MFRYCPACAGEKIHFEQNKVFRCPDCGFTYYHNTAAATACIVNTKAGFLFLVRNREPGKGMLDLPGGFVDPGEGAVDGLHREFIEELGIDPLSSPWKTNKGNLHGVCEANSSPGFDKDGKIGEFVFFASFPNKYLYKNIWYNTCDLFFYLDAPYLSEKDLQLEKAEISGVRFVKAEEFNMENIAFESVKKAVRLYLEMFHKKPD